VNDRQRVRITHPRTEAARRGVVRAPSREIDEQTAVGETYMRSLIASQRRLAVRVCAAVGAMLVGTALLSAAAPGVMGARILGIPLAWLVLGLLVYPALLGIAAYAVRTAERNERAFTVLLLRHR
jgi:hypothetical protein